MIFAGGGESSLGVAKLLQRFGLNFDKAFKKKYDSRILAAGALQVFDRAAQTPNNTLKCFLTVAPTDLFSIREYCFSYKDDGAVDGASTRSFFYVCVHECRS